MCTLDLHEMPKFRKTESELVTLLDKWLYAMKNLATLMERPAVLQEAVFRRFFEQAEIAAFSKEELRSYRESQKDFWDLNSVIETAENKGIAKGRAEGIVEGRAEAAHKMIAAGIPIEKVLEILGLTAEDIQ